MSRLSHPLVQVGVAVLLTLPWIGSRIAGVALGTLPTVAAACTRTAGVVRTAAGPEVVD